MQFEVRGVEVEAKYGIYYLKLLLQLKSYINMVND